jgi:hypothetical protein
VTSIASAPAASAPASGTFTGISPDLPFRRDDSPLFPVSGAVLLFGLIAVAAWLVWWDRRRGRGAGAGFPRWLRSGSAGSDSGHAVQLLSTTRLDATTRVHVLAWQGRQLLVAVQAGQPPVVLDRQPAQSEGSAGAAP